jgi:hypothetical protein
MTLLALAAVAVVVVLVRRRLSNRPGPGASAAARARELRTPLVRLADAAGITTARGRQAAQYRAGADGERRTAVRLAELEREGWTVLHDRALPASRANVDHLAIAPGGAVFVPDSKRWSSRFRVRVVGGRVLHGNVDVTSRLAGLRYEAAAVAQLLGVPVVPVAVIHGAPVEYGELHHDGVLIIPADRLCGVLRDLGADPGPVPHPQLAAQAERLLPPYTRRNP